MSATILPPPLGGLYEHWYGAEDLEAAVRYWAQLGYQESARATLEANTAGTLYGHRAALRSVRLTHRATDRQGCIRVLSWERAAGPGLGFAHMLSIGSRWSGFYTRDLPQIRDAFLDEANSSGVPWRVSDVARLFISDMKPSFYQPFVGIRESTVFGPAHRMAFLQRIGFDRPGFGTFDAATPLSCTESTHGCLVMPNIEDHEFYAQAFGLSVQTPLHQIDWTNAAVRKSLALEEGEVFSGIVYQVPGEPSGFLRLYHSQRVREDLRHLAHPGQLGNCGLTYRFAAASLAARREQVTAAGATQVSALLPNEFGELSFSFRARDGAFWSVLGQ